MELEIKLKELEQQRDYLLNECKQKNYQIETLIKEIQKIKTIIEYK
jgi:hypothetical protein